MMCTAATADVILMVDDLKHNRSVCLFVYLFGFIVAIESQVLKIDLAVFGD